MTYQIVRGTPQVVPVDRPTSIWPTSPSNFIDDTVEEARRRRFQKAMALKDSIGLTDDERYSIAQLIPGVDKDYGGSWRELDPKQLHDLITMLEGFVFITALLGQR